MKDILIVGIAGGSGSGKTTINSFSAFKVKKQAQATLLRTSRMTVLVNPQAQVVSVLNHRDVKNRSRDRFCAADFCRSGRRFSFPQTAR